MWLKFRWALNCIQFIAFFFFFFLSAVKIQVGLLSSVMFRLYWSCSVSPPPAGERGPQLGHKPLSSCSQRAILLWWTSLLMKVKLHWCPERTVQSWLHLHLKGHLTQITQYLFYCVPIVISIHADGLSLQRLNSSKMKVNRLSQWSC